MRYIRVFAGVSVQRTSFIAEKIPDPSNQLSEPDVIRHRSEINLTDGCDVDAPILEAIGSAVGYSNHSPDLSARLIQVPQVYRSSSMNALMCQVSGELELKVKTLVLVESCFGDSIVTLRSWILFHFRLDLPSRR